MHVSYLFAVYDSKAEAFLNPVVFETKGLAIRQFEAMCRDASTDFHKFCEDYTLFELGAWRRSDGSIELHPKPEAVLRASVVVASAKEASRG